MIDLDTFLAALALQAGYNAALVAVGAALLGAAAGGAGAFVFLRKRALVSDAVAHATLPGVALAFLAMAAAGGDGRLLAGLLAGAALSAGLGLLTVEWIARRTRLAEDAAIGAVLSVFYGIGIVLLTVVQSAGLGRAAGLEGFLLGAAAAMLFQDALLVAALGALAFAAVLVLRRPMTLVAFDEGYAAALGLSPRRVDLAMMALVLGIVVAGLKIAGLVLIVALLIIPAAAARFWTDRTEALAALAAAIGAASGWVGAALSAAAPGLPTGPVIVLAAFAVFAASLLLSPGRGALAALLRRRALSARVHRRQGLLALARGEAVYDAQTLRLLRREGLIRPDGVATDDGRAQAAKALRDERRWAEARRLWPDDPAAGRYDGLTEIETILTRDAIAELDLRLGPPAPAPDASGPPPAGAPG
ncbi:MAG: metal ABC transporter permease [Pseudomonadota bacterium]